MEPDHHGQRLAGIDGGRPHVHEKAVLRALVALLEEIVLIAFLAESCGSEGCFVGWPCLLAVLGIVERRWGLPPSPTRGGFSIWDSLEIKWEMIIIFIYKYSIIVVKQNNFVFNGDKTGLLEL